MKYKLLASKSLYSGRVGWKLVSCNLYEYLISLRMNFYDFDVQRRIVSNSYLDKIGDSILNGEPLPAFTITVNSIDENIGDLNIGEMEILDGLQRTYRLWIAIFLDRIIKNGYNNFDELYEAIKCSEEGQRMIQVRLVNRSKVRDLIENNSQKLNELISAYKSSDIILNVWSGLTDEEIVKKMLTLNAGQRSVSSTHQFELLFLHCFKNLRLSNQIRIIREKDNDYVKVKRGERKLGEYLMSSIIIALQSYVEKQPLRINQVNKLRIEDSIVPEYSSVFFTNQRLYYFIELISQIDISSIDNEKLNSWLMKDTTLSGIFAALGKVTDSASNFEIPQIQKCLNRITDLNINVDEFETSYQKLSSVHTNVGNAVRKAVYHYFMALFEGPKISWSEAFNKKRDEQI